MNEPCLSDIQVDNNEIVVNQPGNDTNFRVEGTYDSNLFFVDAGMNNVGISTSHPGSKLDVNGDLTVREDLHVDQMIYASEKVKSPIVETEHFKVVDPSGVVLLRITDKEFFISKKLKLVTDNNEPITSEEVKQLLLPDEDPSSMDIL
jgi:hypothetical protein